MIGLKKRDIKKALKAGAKAGGVSLADIPVSYTHLDVYKRQDNEVFAYYELIPYNYSFLSAEQKFIVHDSFRQLIAQSRDCLLYTSRCV